MEGRLRVLLGVWALLQLTACATSYQASGFTGGYTETKLSDSAYIVSFNGNGNTPKDRVYFFWLYRCAELTLQQGYSIFALRPNQHAGLRPSGPGPLRPASYDPEEKGAFIKTGVIVVPATPSIHWSNSATVLMFKAPLPPELVWAIDANAVIEALKPFVASNGGGPMPNRVELFQRVFIAHARIEFGGGMRTAGSDAPRPIGGIVDTLREAQFLELHTLFRRYALGAGGGAPLGGGSVALEFTVSPNGQVTNCTVSSSSFGQSPFPQAVADIIRKTEFRPLDVASTTISDFRITFEPL